MKPALILDTGPLVALLSSADTHHRWAREALAVRARVVTVEAVVSEAWFLLRNARARRALMNTVATIEVVSMSQEVPKLKSLMERFEDVPMSFADACVTRVSELIPDCLVATTDSDFLIYRRNGRAVIPTLMPG
ncbi:MAG: PIN domain-containing protein [Myxococcaceae bacterium]